MAKENGQFYYENHRTKGPVELERTIEEWDKVLSDPDTVVGGIINSDDLAKRLEQVKESRNLARSIGLDEYADEFISLKNRLVARALEMRGKGNPNIRASYVYHRSSPKSVEIGVLSGEKIVRTEASISGISAEENTEEFVRTLGVLDADTKF